jgi:hypothetical protein
MILNRAARTEPNADLINEGNSRVYGLDSRKASAPALAAVSPNLVLSREQYVVGQKLDGKPRDWSLD